MSATRIRPDKQIQAAPGQGYTLYSDSNGELQPALLSALFPKGAAGQSTDISSIDSMQLNGNTLVLNYTDNTGTHFIRTCDLTSLAVSVKVTGAILLHPEASTYMLQLTASDGNIVTVNLSDLLPVVTRDTADIIFTGNGTAANPLSAVLTDAARVALRGYTHRTDEFTGLPADNTVELSYTPVYPFPLHVYRNGLRQKERVGWQYDAANPKIITLLGASFTVAGRETVIVDYMTADKITPVLTAS